MPTAPSPYLVHKDGASALPREMLFSRKFYSLHKIPDFKKQTKVVGASGEVLSGHALLGPAAHSFIHSLPPNRPFFSVFQRYCRDAFQHPPAGARAAISPHPNRTLIVAHCLPSPPSS